MINNPWNESERRILFAVADDSKNEYRIFYYIYRRFDDRIKDFILDALHKSQSKIDKQLGHKIKLKGEFPLE